MKLVTPLKRRWVWVSIWLAGLTLGLWGAMRLSTGLVVGFTVFRAGFCDPVYLGLFSVLEAGIVVQCLSGHWGDSILTGGFAFGWSRGGGMVELVGWRRLD